MNKKSSIFKTNKATNWILVELAPFMYVTDIMIFFFISPLGCPVSNIYKVICYFCTPVMRFSFHRNYGLFNITLTRHDLIFHSRELMHISHTIIMFVKNKKICFVSEMTIKVLIHLFNRTYISLQSNY